MSVEIIAQEDQGFQTSSEGATTITRTMAIEADNMMEIFTSNKIPQRGWRHPDNSAFYLDTIEITKIGNKNRKCQAQATINYNNATELVREFDGDPWDLGAQNFTSNFVPINVPFLNGYDEDGNPMQNLNSAGCRIEAETTEYIREINFDYCVKASGSRGDFDGAEEAIINKSTDRIAGISIAKRTGLLLPMSSTFITEYEASGNEIKRQYWNVNVTIQIKKTGWRRDELDIGTMCYFRNRNGEVVRRPRSLYSYSAWSAVSDDYTNRNANTIYGSIDDVIAAKRAYAKSVKGSFDPDSVTSPTQDQLNNYQRAYDQLPFEEVTEPFPLSFGEFYQNAMENPDLYPYQTIKIYDAKIASWNQFDLPSTRA